MWDNQLDMIAEAVMQHSKWPSPKDNPVTVILKDADKLANLEPLTLAVRASQWQADLSPVNLVHLDQYPPKCNYKKPGSILRDLVSSLEWEGECEYEPGKKIPWLRIPKAVELAKPMFKLLRGLISATIHNYKAVGLIPYPFPEDFETK
ncbi:MAG: hypothetical protein HY219_02930 [Candidatus Staskawiczbacteria bacterium]|nr:hypothetical protein [Candidatus Staskawiczbacteria bacterium]